MQEKRKERYGIGSDTNGGHSVDSEKYGRGKRSASKSINYLKLNDGLDTSDDTPTSPKRPKSTSHTPVRSGPSLQRQTAQKQVTVNPTVMTISTVKTKKSNLSTCTEDALPGVPTTTVDNNKSTKNCMVNTTEVVCHEVSSTSSASELCGGLGVTDAFFGVPENSDNNKLPDLGQSTEITIGDVLNQSQTHTVEAGSTEEELDAADTLLSLSSVRNNLSLGTDEFEDNSLLMPIGAQPPIEDIAPEPLRLGNMDVDNAIALMITAKEQEKLETTNTDSLLGIQGDADIESMTNPDNIVITEDTATHENMEVQSDSLLGVPGITNNGAKPNTKSTETDVSVSKKGSRGAFKSQLYGLKKQPPKDRSYKCQICDVTKRSTESLNAHHRKRHGTLNCTVCGKIFNLATSLTHHMYTHFPRKFYCDRCNYHCRFQSELESHKITHRAKPSYQCMYPNCGKWFKRKGELTLHVETHRKVWYDCRKCDFSTRLIKYLKEHEKSHKKELPYSCNICGEKFLW